MAHASEPAGEPARIEPVLLADPLQGELRAVERLVTLADVIRWGLAQSPARVVAEVIVQDEYCHDVVMPWHGEYHLVFDTT